MVTDGFLGRNGLLEAQFGEFLILNVCHFCDGLNSWCWEVLWFLVHEDDWKLDAPLA